MAQVSILREEIPIPEGITVTVDEAVTIKGSKGTLTRNFNNKKAITISVEGDNVVVEARFPKKKEKAMLGTIRSHINNMIIGLTDGFSYKMKIVYAHFPMTVKKTGDKITIENFLGERHPRSAKIVGDADVKIKGDEVIVSGINKEHVGQTMANMEQATKIKGRDPRVFQDGIYLVSKE
ncbi:ribosomal protein L6P [Methanobacterium lacus]|uniref:Large ribosomal subunit protein uL6 n=1 Tax=Methanobacterium lacus (strain AL-21) TaxID=877455 RepID=F0TB91_METLA|nr:50S ribosomal protein L6 [Methanobacterium lacus]ADZ09042.1 ribosomal protein L6P [Methanobacterium lacus]